MTQKGLRISEQATARALRKTGGNLTAAARLLHCSVNTIYRRIRQSKKLQRTIAHQREQMVYLAEAGLRQKLLEDKPDLKAIIFTLKTLGKDRGYVERVEHELSAGLRVAGRSREEVIAEILKEAQQIAEE